MCGYKCPFAERKPCAGFLLCRDLYQEGVDYNIRANAMNVICVFQKQCMKTGRMENTNEAQECYRMRTQAKQAKPAETEPEETPDAANTPKVRKKT